MTYKTLQGQTYSVTSAVGTVITATVDEQTFTLLTLAANKQGAFTAISDEVTSTDENAVIFPFVEGTSSAGVASAISQSGTGGGGGGEPGPQGPAGPSGRDGGYYEPQVSEEGELSWRKSDATMPDPPAPINIKGESGLTEEQLELLLTFASSEGKNVPIVSTGQGDGFRVLTGHTYVVINTQTDMAILIPQPTGDPVQVDLIAGRQTAVVAMTGTEEVPSYILVEYANGTTVTEVFKAAAPLVLGGGGEGGYDHYTGGFDVDDNGIIKPESLVIPAYTFKGLSFQAFEFPENYQFSATLPFLYDATRMFKHSINLKSYTNASSSSRFNHLEYCDNMFLGCLRLESVNEDFSYVKSAEGCFSLCLALTSWDKSLRSLKNGKDMFSGSGLTSFSLPEGENFASLENAENMFYGTDLPIAEVIKILDYLPDKSPETIDCYHGPYPFGISIPHTEEAVLAFGNKTGIWPVEGQHQEGVWKGWSISVWIRET